MSLRLNFCRSVPPEFLRSLFLYCPIWSWFLVPVMEERSICLQLCRDSLFSCSTMICRYEVAQDALPYQRIWTYFEWYLLHSVLLWKHLICLRPFAWWKVIMHNGTATDALQKLCSAQCAAISVEFILVADNWVLSACKSATLGTALLMKIVDVWLSMIYLCSIRFQWKKMQNNHLPSLFTFAN